MDFFALNPANGILSINTDALHGDLNAVPSGNGLTNHTVFPVMQTTAIFNGDVQLSPPKYSATSSNNGFMNEDIPLPPPKK